MGLPRSVKIREVGPREGFQTSSKIIDTAEKIRLIDSLSETGVKEIEITSFVRAETVPQMADAAEVVKGYKRVPGISYTGLYLNQKGFLRAEESGRLDNQAWLNVACSETFLKKNSNTTLEAIVAEVPAWAGLFRQADKKYFGLMVSTAFGCSYEGRIEPARVTEVTGRILDAFAEQSVTLNEICLADTMGWGTPETVKRVVSAVREKFPPQHLSLHLHDTRGSGLANVYAALQLGIDCFDSSVGGMGGCPFAKGAAGNICTEDLIYMCEEMGVKTGLNLSKYVESAKLAESIMGSPLAGKVYRSFGGSC